MKTLLLALLIFSSCDKLYSSDKAKPPEVINCMAVSYIPEDPLLMSKRISASVSMTDMPSRPDAPPEARITMNDEVIYDSCAGVSSTGLWPYLSENNIAFNLNLEQNRTWRDAYFGSGEEPVRNDISIKVEARARCEAGDWETLVDTSSAVVEWHENSGGCLPPGYYGTVSGLPGSSRVTCSFGLERLLRCQTEQCRCCTSNHLTNL